MGLASWLSFRIALNNIGKKTIKIMRPHNQTEEFVQHSQQWENVSVAGYDLEL